MLPFISHEDLNAYLETSFTGGELLVLIALDGACEAVRRELHRTLNLVEDDEIVLDGNATGTLILPERPVHEVSDVTLDDAAVEDEFYYLDKERGVLYFNEGSIWTWGKGNITLTYTHGYALDEDDVAGTITRVPSNIRLVALRLAAAVYRSKGVDIGTAAGVTTGEKIGTYSYTSDVTVAQATSIASINITDEDRIMLSGQRDVFAA